MPIDETEVQLSPSPKPTQLDILASQGGSRQGKCDLLVPASTMGTVDLAAQSSKG